MGYPGSGQVKVCLVSHRGRSLMGCPAASLEVALKVTARLPPLVRLILCCDVSVFPALEAVVEVLAEQHV